MGVGGSRVLRFFGSLLQGAPVLNGIHLLHEHAAPLAVGAAAVRGGYLLDVIEPFFLALGGGELGPLHRRGVAALLGELFENVGSLEEGLFVAFAGTVL